MQQGEITIREANRGDLAAWITLRDVLWPGEDHRVECEWILRVMERAENRGVGAGTCFLAMLHERGGAPARVVGIMEGTVRSHADGCEPGVIAFMEGWVVDPEARRRGVGRALAERFAEWGRAQGCKEIASDTYLDNSVGLAAHLALGFEVVDRAINFKKAL